MDDLRVDIAILGAGACGTMAALRASQDGHTSVAVFDKNLAHGGNAGISSGSLAAGGTELQREAGVVDSPELHASDVIAASGDRDRQEMVSALCESARLYVDWLAGPVGFPLELGLDLKRAGMSALRLHTDVGRLGGGRLMKFLHGEVRNRANVGLVDGAAAVGLETEGDRVMGAVIEQNGEQFRVKADMTLVATDGFAASAAMMQRFCPSLVDAPHGGVGTATGDAFPWLEDLGVDLVNMGSCLRSGLVVEGYGTRVSPALPFNGAVLVNARGERFVDEEAHGYSSLAGRLEDEPGQHALMIWDRVAMQATQESELMRTSIAAGAITDFATYDDLAQHGSRIGFTLSPDVLQPRNGRRPLDAPYFAAVITHGVLATQGGAKVDSHGRPLRIDGEPVPGLRVGGGTAVGLAGPTAKGYVSGNGLLSAFGMGWIVGEDARLGEMA